MYETNRFGEYFVNGQFSSSRWKWILSDNLSQMYSVRKFEIFFLEFPENIILDNLSKLKFLKRLSEKDHSPVLFLRTSFYQISLWRICRTQHVSTISPKPTVLENLAGTLFYRNSLKLTLARIRPKRIILEILKDTFRDCLKETAFEDVFQTNRFRKIVEDTLWNRL